MSLVESSETKTAEAASNAVGSRDRQPGRTTMFKPAQLAFGSWVTDCVLLDLSPRGAQVHLMAPGKVPDLVTLRLPGGRLRAVRRCWNKGQRIGFEVVGTAPLTL
jgi:hypothetical protein